MLKLLHGLLAPDCRSLKFSDALLQLTNLVVLPGVRARTLLGHRVLLYRTMGKLTIQVGGYPPGG